MTVMAAVAGLICSSSIDFSLTLTVDVAFTGPVVVFYVGFQALAGKTTDVPVKKRVALFLLLLSISPK